jgi:ATP-dependent RNA helicase DDX19/DBP5
MSTFFVLHSYSTVYLQHFVNAYSLKVFQFGLVDGKTLELSNQIHPFFTKMSSGDWYEHSLAEEEETKQVEKKEVKTKTPTPTKTETPKPVTKKEEKKEEKKVEEKKPVEKQNMKETVFRDVSNLESIMEDKDSPLFSTMKSFEEFKNLKVEILKGIQAKGFNKPSGIQEKTIPLLIETKKNLIAQAQSGCGKTLCFAVGMIQTVDEDLKEPQCICVAPTLELAQQNWTVVSDVAKFLPKITVQALLKGETLETPTKSQIVVGTPGKLEDMIKKKLVSTKNLKLLILDEADQLLDKNSSILLNQVNSIRKFMPKDIRVALFSATYQESMDETDKGGKKDKEVLDFAETFVPNPKEKILIARTELSLEAIVQYGINCKNETDKFKTLENIFRELEISQTMVFVKTLDASRKLYNYLQQAGWTVSLLTGEVEADKRKALIREFEKGNTKVLISTNVLARGIDVRQVTHVINFDAPVEFDKDRNEKPDPDLYLHRIGRTGRFGRSGFAINFIASDKDKAVYAYFEKYFQKKINYLSSDDDLVKVIV